MKNKTTFDIEPLDEGFVLTVNGKRKAYNSDQLREAIVSAAQSAFQGIKGDSVITIDLETNITKNEPAN